MDKISKSILAAFVEAQGLQSIDEAEQFEYLANYLVMYEELEDSVELDEMAVGKNGNIGVDGLAVIVNGSQVTTQEEVDTLLEANGFIDVTFHFIQAKRSQSFALADLGNFFFAINDFFDTQPKLPHTPAVENLMALKDYIYTKSAAMHNRNPNVAMHFVCTGTWNDEIPAVARVDAQKKELKSMNLFADILFQPVGAAELQSLHRRAQGKLSVDFVFAHRLTLPVTVRGVKEAHFGLIEFGELLKLLTDSAGNIRSSVFFDNVRAFQGMNDVNKSIRQTLQSGDSNLFPLLNNGLTVIAREVRPTGNTFHLEDFQIVNGCQTSNVLFGERGRIAQMNSTLIPIRVIATSEDDVVNEIIRATNFQTEVTEEQLFALSSFQKQLEAYYATTTGADRLHYERRSKQYSGNGSVQAMRIVTILQQIRAFTATFLEEPHRGHYPRSARTVVGKTLFVKNHRLEPYYLSSLLLFKLERLFTSKSVDPSYKPARYHLLLGARWILLPEKVPALHSNEMEKYCKRLLKLIEDDSTLTTAFRDAVDAVDTACGTSALTRSLTKTQPFTKSFIDALRTAYPLT